MKIEYVSYGLGNNFGDTIELNKNLKSYPDIHNFILRHELEHTDSVFSFKDLILDISETKVDNWKIFKFMVKHPLSFIQFLPVYYTKKRGIVYDINLLLFYSLFFSIIYLAFVI